MKISDIADRNEKQTGLGLSLNDYLDLVESDLAPAISEITSLTGCKTLSFTTMRPKEGEYSPEDEVEQRLVLEADGNAALRCFTYNKGEGHHGIGRVTEGKVRPNAMKEILHMMDTWLYSRRKKAADIWNSGDGSGRWILHVRFADGRVQVQTGKTEGAFYAGIDISQFIRERLPFDGLLLFDDRLW